MKKLARALLILGLAFVLAGCRGNTPSPYDQINEMLDQVEYYLTRSSDDFQRSDRLAEELRDNFCERTERNKNLALLAAIWNRDHAHDLATEAMKIASEHGIDVLAMVRQRRTPGIMELFE